MNRIGSVLTICVGLALLFPEASPRHASAALPPWVYKEARQNAPYHLQVAISDVEVPTKTPGSCPVAGKIVRIFRDKPGRLSDGAVIRFSVACTRESDPPLVGGTQWTYVSNLSRAKFIEVYLYDRDGKFEVAQSQSKIIDAPSSKPQLPVD